MAYHVQCFSNLELQVATLKPSLGFGLLRIQKPDVKQKYLYLFYI